MATAHLVQELVQDLGAARRVLHLGMKLQAVPAARVVCHGRTGGIVALGDEMERVGHSFHAVAVAHPHVERGVQALEEGGTWIDDGYLSGSILAPAGGNDLAAQGMGQQLHAVAQAKDRLCGLCHIGRQGGCAGIVYAVRAARQNESHWPVGHHCRRVRAPGIDLTVDMQLAHPAGDQLRVLRTIVQDNDRLALVEHALSFYDVISGWYRSSLVMSNRRSLAWRGTLTLVSINGKMVTSVSA